MTEAESEMGREGREGESERGRGTERQTRLGERGSEKDGEG